MGVEEQDWEQTFPYFPPKRLRISPADANTMEVRGRQPQHRQMMSLRGRYPSPTGANRHEPPLRRHNSKVRQPLQQPRFLTWEDDGDAIGGHPRAPGEGGLAAKFSRDSMQEEAAGGGYGGHKAGTMPETACRLSRLSPSPPPVLDEDARAWRCDEYDAAAEEAQAASRMKTSDLPPMSGNMSSLQQFRSV